MLSTLLSYLARSLWDEPTIPQPQVRHTTQLCFNEPDESQFSRLRPATKLRCRYWISQRKFKAKFSPLLIVIIPMMRHCFCRWKLFCHMSALNGAILLLICHSSGQLSNSKCVVAHPPPLKN